MDDLEDLTVLEGPFAGQPAAVALKNEDFRDKAARWKPGTGSENRRRIGGWAKTLKAWAGLGGGSKENGDDEVGADPPAIPVVGLLAQQPPLPRAADEPPPQR